MQNFASIILENGCSRQIPAYTETNKKAHKIEQKEGLKSSTIMGYGPPPIKNLSDMR